jgi:murein L,D-transpeptidase YcbB/YkuD
MKARPIFIGIAAIFSASAIAGGQASQGSQNADPQSQNMEQQAPGASSGSSAQSAAAAGNPEVVKQAQEKLGAAGHDAGQPDGQLGPKTQAAVKEFQESKGLQASGQLDQQTLAALEIGTPEGTTTSSSAGSSGGTGGAADPGFSSDRTAEPQEQPKSQ